MPAPSLPHDYMDRILRAWWQRAPEAAVTLAFGAAGIRVHQLLETAPVTLRRHADGVALAEDVDGRFVAHLEMETAARSTTLLRVALYGLQLHQLHDLPVRSALVLLEPAPSLSSRFTMRHGQATLCEYAIEVVEIYRIAADLLCQDPHLAVLAPLAAGATPAHLVQARHVILANAPARERGDQLASLYILAGRKFSLDQFRHLFTREELMESVSLRAEIEDAYSEGIEKGIEKGIETGVERGRLAALRSVIDRLTESRFPGASRELAPLLDACDTENLDALVEAVLRVATVDVFRAAICARLESPTD